LWALSSMKHAADAASAANPAGGVANKTGLPANPI
jgi:hypothetical protein